MCKYLKLKYNSSKIKTNDFNTSNSGKTVKNKKWFYNRENLYLNKYKIFSNLPRYLLIYLDIVLILNLSFQENHKENLGNENVY